MVINRNGDTVRSFAYAEGLMVTHSNALGLGCHYRWETQGDTPRVVEHWTSDGEHYHFRYDLGARTSWATDVLGRELEVQYNADHRVIASRDYGGERYAVELDEQGRLVMPKAICMYLKLSMARERLLKIKRHPACSI